MGNDRAVHLLHREKGFCSIRADHCQCGRPGIPDRRTDRRRKSRPDYRKSASDRVRENSASLAGHYCGCLQLPPLYGGISRAVSGSDPKRGYDHCFQNRSMPGGRKTAHPGISAGN